MKQKPGKPTKVEAYCPSPVQVMFHPAIKKYLGYCFSKVAMRIRAAFEERFQEFGLVGPQLGMLIIVREDGPITQNELGKYMAIDKATMVRLIDQLEERKLLTRTQSKQDRRANHLQITKAGEQMIVKMDEARKKCEEEVFAPLSKAEREQLSALLQKLAPTAPAKAK